MAASDKNNGQWEKLPRTGFTLIELLVVIGIISILTGILLPVFAKVRERGRSAACISNLRQIGAAMQMYAQDSNDQFPYGGDPCDLYTAGWDGTPYGDQVSLMRPLNEVLTPYISAPALWRCPSDFGYTTCSLSGNAHLNAAPTAFDDFGMSYLYNTMLPLQHESMSSVTTFDLKPPYAEHGSADIILLGDAIGTWHGGGLLGTPRYNLLFVDGHAATVTEVRVRELWGLQLSHP